MAGTNAGRVREATGSWVARSGARGVGGSAAMPRRALGHTPPKSRRGGVLTDRPAGDPFGCSRACALARRPLSVRSPSSVRRLPLSRALPMARGVAPRTAPVTRRECAATRHATLRRSALFVHKGAPLTPSAPSNGVGSRLNRAVESATTSATAVWELLIKFFPEALRLTGLALDGTKQPMLVSVVVLAACCIFCTFHYLSQKQSAEQARYETDRYVELHKHGLRIQGDHMPGGNWSSHVSPNFARVDYVAPLPTPPPPSTPPNATCSCSPGAASAGRALRATGFAERTSFSVVEAATVYRMIAADVHRELGTSFAGLAVQPASAAQTADLNGDGWLSSFEMQHGLVALIGSEHWAPELLDQLWVSDL